MDWQVPDQWLECRKWQHLYLCQCKAWVYQIIGKNFKRTLKVKSSQHSTIPGKKKGGGCFLLLFLIGRKKTYSWNIFDILRHRSLVSTFCSLTFSKVKWEHGWTHTLPASAHLLGEHPCWFVGVFNSLPHLHCLPGPSAIPVLRPEVRKCV